MQVIVKLQRLRPRFGPTASLVCVFFGLLPVSTVRSVVPVTPANSAPIFTAEQASAGKNIYVARCASCHGESLEGAAGPALSAEAFASRWENGHRTVEDLLQRISTTMPLGAPRSLSSEDYSAVTAFLLETNGHAAGSVALGPENVKVPLTVSSRGAMPPVRSGAPPDLPTTPVSLGAASSGKPDDDELERADDSVWLMYNKSFSGQRYSALRQITADNVGRLGAVCMFQAGEVGNFQTAPVVYDGMMYITTPYNTFALDPRTCAKLWEHRYPEDKAVTLALSRGVAIYRGKVFRATPNGHVIALDAKSGQLLWDVWMADKERGYWLSGAPIAYRGKVFMGSAGADWGANGVIYAFDADTGRHLWKFNTIPSGDEVGADTWTKGAARGGGSFWSTFALDRDSGLLFASIGNPSPDYNGALRPGDNLFSNSVVALDAQTGKLSWWVQQQPHDTHDWDTAAAPILYEEHGRKFMAVASKDGWLYRYDRDTHQFVGKSEISPHQNADLAITSAGVYHCPGISGGAAWNGPAYSAPQRVLLVNSVHWCGTTRISAEPYVEGSSYFGGDHTWDPPEKARGFTRAFDALTGKELWVREFPTPMLAALTPTAGGVVFTGSLDGGFLALDAATGRTLYRFNTGGAVAGAPSTYFIADRQYVAIATGNTSRVHWMTGGSMTIVVFALQRN